MARAPPVGTTVRPPSPPLRQSSSPNVPRKAVSAREERYGHRQPAPHDNKPGRLSRAVGGTPVNAIAPGQAPASWRIPWRRRAVRALGSRTVSLGTSARSGRPSVVPLSRRHARRSRLAQKPRASCCRTTASRSIRARFVNLGAERHSQWLQGTVDT